MKTRFALPFAVLTATLVLGTTLLTAQDEKGKKSGQYAAPEKLKIMSAEQLMKAVPFDTAAAIDKTKKPDPAADFGVVIVSGSNVGGIGGFALKKTTGGAATGTVATQFYWQNKRYTFGADLDGYGSTPNSWVYEVKDVKIEDKKMYFAIPKAPSGNDQFWVWASNGKDDPEDTSSFNYFGTAMRGERPTP